MGYRFSFHKISSSRCDVLGYRFSTPSKYPFNLEPKFVAADQPAQLCAPIWLSLNLGHLSTPDNFRKQSILPAVTPFSHSDPITQLNLPLSDAAVEGTCPHSSRQATELSRCTISCSTSYMVSIFRWISESTGSLLYAEYVQTIYLSLRGRHFSCYIWRTCPKWWRRLVDSYHNGRPLTGGSSYDFTSATRIAIRGPVGRTR